MISTITKVFGELAKEPIFVARMRQLGRNMFRGRRTIVYYLEYAEPEYQALL